jgi:hypothetical protein
VQCADLWGRCGTGNPLMRPSRALAAATRDTRRRWLPRRAAKHPGDPNLASNAPPDRPHLPPGADPITDAVITWMVERSACKHQSVEIEHDRRSRLSDETVHRRNRPLR